MDPGSSTRRRWLRWALLVPLLLVVALAVCEWQRWPFLPEAMAHRLARAYGTRISDIVGSAKTLEELGAHFGAGLTRAEVDYLRNHEWAQSADDILWRRTKLGLHMSAAERESLACVFDDARTEAETERADRSSRSAPASVPD